jgi:hypothetical protein
MAMFRRGVPSTSTVYTTYTPFKVVFPTPDNDLFHMYVFECDTALQDPAFKLARFTPRNTSRSIRHSGLKLIVSLHCFHKIIEYEHDHTNKHAVSIRLVSWKSCYHPSLHSDDRSKTLLHFDPVTLDCRRYDRLHVEWLRLSTNHMTTLFGEQVSVGVSRVSTLFELDT